MQFFVYTNTFIYFRKTGFGVKNQVVILNRFLKSFKIEIIRCVDLAKWFKAFNPYLFLEILLAGQCLASFLYKTFMRLLEFLKKWRTRYWAVSNILRLKMFNAYNWIWSSCPLFSINKINPPFLDPHIQGNEEVFLSPLYNHLYLLSLNIYTPYFNPY